MLSKRQAKNLYWMAIYKVQKSSISKAVFPPSLHTRAEVPPLLRQGNDLPALFRPETSRCCSVPRPFPPTTRPSLRFDSFWMLHACPSENAKITYHLLLFVSVPSRNTSDSPRPSHLQDPPSATTTTTAMDDAHHDATHSDRRVDPSITLGFCERCRPPSRTRVSLSSRLLLDVACPSSQIALTRHARPLCRSSTTRRLARPRREGSDAGRGALIRPYFSVQR